MRSSTLGFLRLRKANLHTNSEWSLHDSCSLMFGAPLCLSFRRRFAVSLVFFHVFATMVVGVVVETHELRRAGGKTAERTPTLASHISIDASSTKHVAGDGQRGGRRAWPAPAERTRRRRRRRYRRVAAAFIGGGGGGSCALPLQRCCYGGGGGCCHMAALRATCRCHF